MTWWILAPIALGVAGTAVQVWFKTARRDVIAELDAYREQQNAPWRGLTPTPTGDSRLRQVEQPGENPRSPGSNLIPKETEQP